MAIGAHEVVLWLPGAVGELEPALADARVGEGVDPVVLHAAGGQGDASPLPGRATVIGVHELPVETEPHAPDGVDQVGEALQVDRGVELHREPQVEPDRPFQGAHPALPGGGWEVGAPGSGVTVGIGRELVDLQRIDAVGIDAAVRKGHGAGVARHRDHDRGACHRIDADRQDRVGERLVAAPLPGIDAEQQEGDPLRAVPAVFGAVQRAATPWRGEAAGEDVRKGGVDAPDHQGGPGVHPDGGDQQQGDDGERAGLARLCNVGVGRGSLGCQADGQARLSHGGQPPGHQCQVEHDGADQERRGEELVAQLCGKQGGDGDHRQHEQEHGGGEDGRQAWLAGIGLPQAREQEREESRQRGVLRPRANRQMGTFVRACRAGGAAF